MELWDHTVLALVIIIDINSGERSWTRSHTSAISKTASSGFNIRLASPFSPSGADALTSTGQDGKPDEIFSCADLSLQQGSVLPPTRSMINPHQRQHLLSPLTLPFIFSFHSVTTPGPSILFPFVSPFVSCLGHLKAVIDCLLVHITALPPRRRYQHRVPLSSLRLISGLLSHVFLLYSPHPTPPWLHLHSLLSSCSLLSSPLIPHFSGSSHFYFPPRPRCVAPASRCWLSSCVGEESEKVSLQ